jgi:hypothetical protein
VGTGVDARRGDGQRDPRREGARGGRRPLRAVPEPQRRGPAPRARPGAARRRLQPVSRDAPASRDRRSALAGR